MPTPANRVPVDTRGSRIRPTLHHSSVLGQDVLTDNSWKIFGALIVVALVSCAAYCAWKALATPVEELTPIADVVATPAPSTPPAVSKPFPRAIPPSVMTSQFLSWQELTLMLRTGLTDDEIIAVIKSRSQSVPAIGPAEAESLRELGAGNKLVNFLRTRPAFTVIPTAERVVVSAPALPDIAPPTRVTGVLPGTPVLSPSPVDYAAKDRRIKDLQSQIDNIDRQILNLRNHPNNYSYMGNYNGPGYQYGTESWFKNYLDQLDKQRNDLRRQKWQLEGR